MKKIIGYLLVATPIATLIVLILDMYGPGYALGIFVGTAFVTGMMVTGIELIDP